MAIALLTDRAVPWCAWCAEIKNTSTVHNGVQRWGCDREPMARRPLRFVIQPFVNNPPCADEAWARNRIAAIITAIDHWLFFEGEASAIRLEDVYRQAYHLVLYRYGHMLYAAVKKRLLQLSHDKISREKFMQAAQMVRDVCMYMERTYIPAKRKTPMLELAARFYDARKPRSLAHWRRIAPLVGRWRKVLMEMYTEVKYRPGHSGAKRSRAEFEAAANELCS